MPLRGLLYRKLKQKMAARAKKEIHKKAQDTKTTKEKGEKNFESIKTKYVSPMPEPAAQKEAQPNGEALKGSARYWGGHFLYPIKTVELGEIVVSKNLIQFIKYGFLKRTEWTIEIPLSKIEWNKVSQVMEEDGIYNITCFTIPFKDDKGIRHQPKFSVENSAAREHFSKFLYERMPRKK